MSRRMDRAGVPRSHTQHVENTRFWADPRCVGDAEGWLQPFANHQGWEEFNRAAYALRCVLIWSSIEHPAPMPLFRRHGARVESDLRSFRFHLARSRKCDRPALP